MALWVPAICDRLYLVEGRGPEQAVFATEVRSAIVRSVAWTAAGAAAATAVSMRGSPAAHHARSVRFVPEWPYVVGAPIASLCLVALVVLWFRRRSILDLFLMVVLCAYLIEIPPHYYPFPARFSTGWYAVRVTSLLSSSYRLGCLALRDNGAVRRPPRRGASSASRTRGALDDWGRRRSLDCSRGQAAVDRNDHERRCGLSLSRSFDAQSRQSQGGFQRIATDGHRAGTVVESIRANFKTDDRTRTSLDVNELIEEALSLEGGDLQKHRILVQAETAAQLPEVRGNRVQLQQVLINLITNAIDSMAAKDEPRVLCVKSEAHQGSTS